MSFSLILASIIVCAALAACASQPDPAKPGEPERRGNGCFDIEREPGEQGGLRIPRQTVCPPFSPTTENQR